MSELDNHSFKLSRATILYSLLSLIGAFWAVYFYNTVPNTTDSYYHMNGAISIASGDGFVDNYLWTFIGAPDTIPAPSHLYWMPGTSIISALGIAIFGIGYGSAQLGLALCLWGAMLLAYWLAWKLGKSANHAWVAGVLTLFSGFFLDTWGQTDTFAPYAFFGAMSLVFMSLGITEQKRNIMYWLLAGAFAGFGHLIRSDGLILVIVGWSVLLWVFNRERFTRRILWLIPFTFAYIAVMSPWFIRNYNEIGRVLPTGGTQNAYFTTYNELFNYPPDASLDNLLANNGEALIETRSRALFTNNGIPIQAIAYQGIIVFFPFILLGLWKRRRDAFIRSFWIFALGIHLAFAFVFPEAGMRGGFWHATAALVPIWAVIGLLGLDDFIEWAASKRKTWNPKLAKPVLSIGLLLMTVVLSVYLSRRSIVDNNQIALTLADTIPENSRVMLNDPSKLYYYTGIMGVTIPNETAEIALEIADVYDIDYILLEDNGITEPLRFEETPDFLIPIEFDREGARLYAFDRD